MASRNDIAVSVRGLAKSYTIAHNEDKHNTLAETMLARLKNPFDRPKKETFWALKDVSFEIKKGEVVGIIGRNGAGKSTLLKVLSRITEPTKGEIDIYGRVGSLLEVGTGFHYELTGRENIYLNGAILGMSRREISKQFDAIVSFADVEKFLDTPVKRYSSGMFVRLAFAVAAHLNPEILIVDEVLAVGDAEFQKKCLSKMKEVSAAGRTVLFVSHNIGVVRALCERGIVLGKGSVAFDGKSDEAAEYYLSILNMASLQAVEDRRDRSGRGAIRFIGVEARGILDDVAAAIVSGGPAEISLRINCWRQGLTLHLLICDDQGQGLTHCTPMDVSPADEMEYDGDGACEIIWSTDELFLTPGSYRVDAALYCDGILEDRIDGLTSFDVQPGIVRGRAFSRIGVYGRLALPYRWSLRTFEPTHVSL